jgi:phosphoribosylamine--glycine ligase
MDKYNVPGRNLWKVFDDPDEATQFIEEYARPVVVKPIGLTGGKGVKIVDPSLTGQLKDLEEAKVYARKVIEEGIGGKTSVLVEEKLVGEEFTFQCFVDGTRVVPTPMVQDNKFAYEGDTGPFTGSMGSFSESNHLLPFMTAMDFYEALQVMEKTVGALRKEGLRYKGALYGGFILTSEGPKVLEFNARWGDPEAMNVLSIFQGDFLDACWAMAEGDLGRISAEFENKATVCKYLAPEGYPTNPVKGKKIEVGEAVESEALVHYASVDERNGEIFMSSSRALACTGIADTMSEAERIAENAISRVRGPVFYRRDIGTKELMGRRIAHMREIRAR